MRIAQIRQDRGITQFIHSLLILGKGLGKVILAKDIPLSNRFLQWTTLLVPGHIFCWKT
jgi:hypothetical protein